MICCDDGSEPYQFTLEVAPEHRAFYDLIMEAGRFEQDSLFGQSALGSAETRRTLEDLFERLVQGEARRVKTELEERADYREYYTYDLKIQHADATHSLYDRVAADKSGGETQNPYYVGGPAALGARGEVVVYTAGFPGPALVDALAARVAVTRFRHWGDADLGGLRIWWLLRRRLGRPLDLFRTDADWLDAAVSGGGGRPLGDGERRGLARLRAELEASPFAGEPDVSAAVRLIAVLLDRGVKVEQER